MMKILVADDDIVFRDVLVERLERWGYEVSVSDNGATTWNLLQSGEFRFLLSDWMMPGIDGISLCQKIRSTRINEYIYIIMLSAKNEKEDTIEGLDAGADDYITKPFEWNELRSRIRSGQRILSLMEEVNTLNSMLPICASCKQVRDDKGYWQQIETYITQHSNTEFTHSICPDCMVKLYPHYYARNKL